MTEKPTKYYSSLQEKRIADYLGWSAVSASGARPFTPGDIKSSDWLAECKTHTSETDTITINKAVWEKIATEAKGSFRRPVLFVDNGTQQIKNTWAIFPAALYYGDSLEQAVASYKETAKKITFKHSELTKNLNKDMKYLKIFIGSVSLYVVKTEVFKELFCGGD